MTEYNTVAELRERGWTPQLIRRFLGEPDHLKMNPRYRTAAPMRLYDSARVARAEASPAFAEAQARAASRRAAAAKATETKRRKTMATIDNAAIEVSSKAGLDTLVRRAIADYNQHLYLTGRDCEPAGRDSDPAFLARITENFVRHRLTAYDALCDALRGRVGGAEAYVKLRRRVDDAVARYLAAAREANDDN